MAIFQDPCIEIGRLKIIHDLYTDIFQDPHIETRRFSGDADNFHDLYMDIFEDTCSETRRCLKQGSPVAAAKSLGTPSAKRRPCLH